MEVHDRNKKLEIIEIDVPERVKVNRDIESSIVPDFVETYNEKISEDMYDLFTCETFCNNLLYEYQLLINLTEVYGPVRCEGCFSVPFKNIFITNKIRPAEEHFFLLNDIVILQSILYSNEELIIKSFKEFCKHPNLLASPETLDLAMRVSGCFVDSVIIHSVHYESVNPETNFEEAIGWILKIIRRWMNRIEDRDWKLLAFLLPKLFSMFNDEDVISHLRNQVMSAANNIFCLGGKKFNESVCLDATLNVLCVMADICFPSETHSIQRFHYKQCLKLNFWHMLRQGLLSSLPQQRKQALYLTKRADEFINSCETQMRLTLDERAMPFWCGITRDAKHISKTMKETSFTIFEALESKQKDLIRPALARFVMRGFFINSDAPDTRCSNHVWQRCLLTRILQYDHDTVKLLGLLDVFRYEPELFQDEEFLLCVINALNHDSHFEINNNETEPIIISQFENCLMKWADSGSTLINKFVRGLFKVSWRPIPIYWVLISLHNFGVEHLLEANTWDFEELQSLRKLIRRSISTHPFPMETYSRTMILLYLNLYTYIEAEPSNFDCMFDLMSLFTSRKCWLLDLTKAAKAYLCWDELLIPRDVQDYITGICKKISTIDQTMESLAIFIDTMTEAKMIMVTEACPTIEALRDLFVNLADAHFRPCADKDLFLKVLELVSHLICCVYNSSAENAKLNEVVLPCRYEIIKIVGNSFLENTNQPYKEYLFAIDCVIESRDIPIVNGLVRELNEFQQKFIRVIANPYEFGPTHWLYAIKMWDIFAKSGRKDADMEVADPAANRNGNDDTDKFSLRQTAKTYFPLMIKYFLNEVVGNERIDDSARQDENERVKFVGDCSTTIASLLCRFPDRYDMRCPNNLWFRTLVAVVEVDDERIIRHVSKIFCHLLEAKTSLTNQDLKAIDVTIKKSWRTVLRLKKSSPFSSNLSPIIKVIVNDEFLELDGAMEYAKECVELIVQEKDDEEKPFEREISGKRTLLEAMKRLNPKNQFLFYEVLTSLLIYDVTPQRDDKIMFATMYHVASFDDQIDCERYYTVRGLAVDYLSDIIRLPESTKIRDSLLNELLEILEKNTNEKCSDNSELHMLKNRVMQALLTISSSLDSSQSQRLYNALCDLLFAGRNPTSVRMMHEWLIIRLCLANDFLTTTLSTLFRNAAEERPGSIVSLATIVFHLAKQFSGPKRIDLIANAIPRLLPHCSNQQSEVRLFSHAIVNAIFEMLPSDTEQAIKVRDDLSAQMKNSHFEKHETEIAKQLLDNFYFDTFDPILDYKPETIYYDLPRLTNVHVNELIPRVIFNTLMSKDRRDDPDTISRIEIRHEKALGQSFVQPDDPTPSIVPSESVVYGSNAVPWETLAPFHPDRSKILKAKRRKRQWPTPNERIIVVASLIDRPTILGELARTCEIMGVKDLIIADKRDVKNREFKKQSEFAEKFMNITEVKPHLLGEYLLQKAFRGWKLVGVEKTADSKNLCETEFPRKTILVLGNEKHGIPANLIPLMDLCVEIPQDGVARSWNGSETGALCLCQYKKGLPGLTIWEPSLL